MKEKAEFKQEPAMPDGGIHRRITQNWGNSVTTWR